MTQLALSRRIATLLVGGFFALVLLAFVLMLLPTGIGKIEILQMGLTNGPLIALSLAAYTYVMGMIKRGDTGPVLKDGTAARLTLVIVWTLLLIQGGLLVRTLFDPPMGNDETLPTAAGAVATIFGGFLAVIEKTLFPRPSSGR